MDPLDMVARAGHALNRCHGSGRAATWARLAGILDGRASFRRPLSALPFSPRLRQAYFAGWRQGERARGSAAPREHPRAVEDT